jgi:O-antigen ligase
LPGRKLRLLSVFLGFWGLVFSGSRGGWLSCSAALLVYFMFAVWRHKARRMQLLGGAIVLTALVSLAAGPLIMTRLSSDDRNAAGSRIPIMGIAFEMIRAHPILGVGVNTYHSVMRSYVPKNYEANYVDQVHNTYLLVLAEMGIVGFVAAFFLMRNLFREAFSCFRTSVEGFQGALGLGLMLVLVQVLVHSMVEAYIAKMPIASLLVLAGLATAARRTD